MQLKILSIILIKKVTQLNQDQGGGDWERVAGMLLRCSNYFNTMVVAEIS